MPSKYDSINITNHLWGKSSPYKSLICHMIDVGVQAQELLVFGCVYVVADELAELFGCSRREAIDLIGYLAALHDIGKCHPLFQQNGQDEELIRFLDSIQSLQAVTSDGFRHEKYSEIALRRLLRFQSLSPFAVKMASTALRLHHQGKAGMGDEPQGIKRREFWQEQQKIIHTLLVELFHPDISLLNKCTNMDCTGVLISGVIILADWLASGQAEFANLSDDGDYARYRALSVHAARRAIENCGLGRQSRLPAQGSFSAFWPEIPEDSVRPLQSACEDLCFHPERLRAGLTIIEAPMGEGKTEAALYLAAHCMEVFGKDGLYMALPTSSTGNQMYARVKKLLESHGINGIKLLHATAWQLDDCTPEGKPEIEDADDASSWLAPLRRGMLSPYAVGTVDQAMLASMSVKYGFLRLLGLSCKTLVLDEVHAYDAYMNQIIERLLSWCSALRIPVVLLSATLPMRKRRAFVRVYAGCSGPGASSTAYPLITSAGPGGSVEELPVRGTYVERTVGMELLPLLGDWESVAALALEKTARGGCLCLIVNTVKEAQELYCAVRAHAGAADGIWIRLFHARFAAAARKRIENECVAAFGKPDPSNPGKRPDRAILVASQVAEQSLDIDFDEMISAVAPIDLLLQRMGRLHRHDGRPRPPGMASPRLSVLTPREAGNYGNTEFVYAPWILGKTLKTLRDVGQIHVPGDLRRLVETVYDAEAPDADSAEFRQWYELVYREQFDAGLAASCLLPPPDAESFFCTQKDMQLFDDDGKEGNYTTAKTRLGEEHVQVAFLDCALYQRLLKQQADGGHPSRALARQVLWRSVSLNAKLVCGNAAQGYDPPLEGRGLLKGFLLLNAKDGKYAFETIELIEDEELGIIVERGRDRG
jgi:CRISPR-associated endonuclease/helicase Cas3